MGTGDASIDSHVADFVSQPTNGTDEALQGTIIIRSPEMGSRGKTGPASEDRHI